MRWLSVLIAFLAVVAVAAGTTELFKFAGWSFALGFGLGFMWCGVYFRIRYGFWPE
jgi:hypothetical protein